MPSEELSTELAHLTGFARSGRYSDKQIETRRETAKRLVAEGKIGGAEFGRMGGRAKGVKKAQFHEMVVANMAKDAAHFYRRQKALALHADPRVAQPALAQLAAMELNAAKYRQDEPIGSVEEAIIEIANVSGGLEVLRDLVESLIVESNMTEVDVVDGEVADDAAAA